MNLSEIATKNGTIDTLQKFLDKQYIHYALLYQALILSSKPCMVMKLNHIFPKTQMASKKCTQKSDTVFWHNNISSLSHGLAW